MVLAGRRCQCLCVSPGRDRVYRVNVGCFLLQNEARKLNHQEVVEEDKRLKLPANWEAKKARLEWELAEDQKKKVGVV